MRNPNVSISALLAAASILAWSAAPVAAQSEDSAVRELLEHVGIKPEGHQRGQMDVVGFVTTAAQMDSVRAQSEALASSRREELRNLRGWTDDAPLLAAVCPHDDYYYAGRLYALVAPHVSAKTVVIFGVFHKARVFGSRDQLVFDSYRTWRGPYGPVKVSPVREALIERLPQSDIVVDNDAQMVEHSVEAIVPWLQAYNRDVEIVSILVPYMDWSTMDRMASELAVALTAVMRENGWSLGRDVALIASTDATHYGDAGWGGSNYADFGTDSEGHRKVVRRDIDLAENHLCGQVERTRLEEFLYKCVDRDDVTKYKITWCGRFSVPFGLDVASRVCEALESRALEGTLLDYGTSVSEASLDLENLKGLGTTAPNNFHHFVGYAAIGYR